MSREKIVLIYDKECPACDNYCQWLNMNHSLVHGHPRELLLIDARHHPEYVAMVTDRGLDINQGMVVLINNEFYYGADAIHVLALISSRSGWFNRINYKLFSSKQRAHYLYPILRFSRNILLKILRKTKIKHPHINNKHHV